MKTINQILAGFFTRDRASTRVLMGSLIRTRFLGIVVLLLSLALTATAAETPRPKYVFLFIGDGMGPMQVTAAELVLAKAKGDKLSFRRFPVAGTQRTQSLSNGTTDSAAAGTAIACGVRTRNGMLGMTASNEPLTSIASKAHEMGWKVGIMTTVSIDNATPAAFYAHATSRGKLSFIAETMAKTPFDFFGGGGMAGQKNETSSNGIDNLQLAISNGFVIARTREDLAKLPAGRKVFAFNHRLMEGAALPWAMDARSDDISLAEFTAAAIRHLQDKPFFMMVEGGKIDYACHANDLAAMVKEVESLDQAVGVAVAFAEKHADETLIVVTADHETGGLSCLEDSNADPKFVLRQTMSGASFAKLMRDEIDKNTAPSNIIPKAVEVFGLTNPTQEERDAIQSNWTEPLPKGDKKDPYANVGPVTDVILGFVAARAGYCFSTADHTGTDVQVYASGAGAQEFAGTYDNTGIYDRLNRLMFPKEPAPVK